MIDHETVECVRQKYRLLRADMDERTRRCWAATEAMALGYGGVSAVAAATGVARNTIAAGVAELRGPNRLAMDRIRRPGAGRKPLGASDPELEAALDALVDPATRGDPESPLRWTCKSTRRLARELTRQGHRVSPSSVARLLAEAGYSLQANRKTREGARHPDRNAQFEFISRRVRAFQRRGWPVLSVDTKKKELLGDFRNGGREWQPAGRPAEVRVHDFMDPRLGKAIPYGVYDVTRNRGWVSVGIDHDTARFAVAALRRWWQRHGAAAFPTAGGVLITADGGGSNSVRNRLWKVALQEWADESAWSIAVSHFPPGTSKWNKIEHRLFCHITNNWRGRPLTSLEAVVQLIAQTTTEAGLVVEAEADCNRYPAGIKVSDDELHAVRLRREPFHGEWNYTIRPRR
jgi:DDE family transposase